MRLVALGILCFFASLSQPLFAQSAEIRKAMQEMAEQVRHIQHGIFTEDFAKISRFATALAESPRVFNREQMHKILDKDAGKFAGTEQMVHQAAQGIAAAAKKKKMKDVLNHTFRMIHNCTSCHSEFRSTVVSAMSR